MRSRAGAFGLGSRFSICLSVQEYLLSLLSDLAKYKPDGIILDRCRYDDYGLMSDFSPESRLC